MRQRELAGVTADLVILTIRDSELQVLLVERDNEPFAGMPALPGGFMRAGETLDQAAVRELGEETGLAGKPLHLEQVRTYSTPGRDPRQRVVTTAYLAIQPDLPAPVAGSDARAANWCPISTALSTKLAFDHDEILRDALDRARGRLEYTTLAAAFCVEPFTITDLRQVYETVWGQPIDPRNFHRKVNHTEGFVTKTDEQRGVGVGRPAALYRRGPAKTLHPPITRRLD